MSRIRHTSALAGLFLLMGSSLGPMAGHAQCRPDQRRITVADTVEMTELSSPEPDAGADPDAIASYSPDGRHFAVIVKKGNLRDNTNRFTLLVFATRSALAHPAPEASVTLASNSNRSAIADLRWVADGHTLLFLGEEPNAEAQIYSFDLASRHLRRLTAQPTSVVRYDASEDSHVIVFETEPAPEDIVDTSGTRRSGFVLHGEELSTVLFSGYHSEQSMAFRPRQLFVMRGEEKPRRVAAQDGIWPFLNLSVSPDGRYALLGALMLHFPPEWMLYKERALHQVVAARRQPQAISEVESYVLLDTRTAMLTSLLDAPKDWPNDGYLWLDRGHTLVVSHAYLPLAGVADPQRTLRASRARVVAVNLPSRTFTLERRAEPDHSRRERQAGAGSPDLSPAR
jgi:dipeptidyl aminopeptidase/acylaminoacyl peptidase